MISSMTGFGRAQETILKRNYTIEISTVNSRYLEISLRLPKRFSGFENDIRKVISSSLSRGKVFASIAETNNGVYNGSLVFNEELADAYYNAFVQLQKKYNLFGSISIDHFSSLPDLFLTEAKDRIEKKELKQLISTLENSLQALQKERLREGNVLAKDMRQRLKIIKTATKKVEKLQPLSLKHFRDKLKKNITTLSKNISDEVNNKSSDIRMRMEMEIAIMAEKIDVTEECIRLKSHLEAFFTTLKESSVVGKRLNFILQEMNREANTIGSKSIVYEISEQVIMIRQEIEKIREQVQNIE